MALLTWRERNSKGDETGPTWFLDFDATLLEEFTRSAEITTYPVEKGALLSDHYQPQPAAITLEVVVSDTPLSGPTVREGEQNAAPSPPGEVGPKALDLKVNRAVVTTVLGTRAITANASRFPTKRTASVLQFTGEVTRVVDVFEALNGLMTSSQILNVLLFSDLEYSNMMIVNLTAPRRADSGSSLVFTIDLVQVTFTDSDNLEAVPVEPQHKRRSGAGNKNGTATSSDPIAFARATSQVYY